MQRSRLHLFGAVVLVVALAVSACTGGSSGIVTSPHSPIATSASPVCDAATIIDAARSLIRGSNEHDPNALQQVLTPDVLGDISRKDQGATAAGGGYEILSGFPKVIAFEKKQWALGETLSYSRIKSFPRGTGSSPGGYFLGLVATYSDGTTQTFGDTKFAYSCSVGAIEHFLQVARAPAA